MCTHSDCGVLRTGARALRLSLLRIIWNLDLETWKLMKWKLLVTAASSWHARLTTSITPSAFMPWICFVVQVTCPMRTEATEY